MAAIETHVGEALDIDPANPGQAFLVVPRERPRPDATIVFWAKYPVKVVHPEYQVWVTPAYKAYRAAWEIAMGKLGDSDIVLDHLYNRKLALAEQLYSLLRLHPIGRNVNTSGGRGLEQSAKDQAKNMKLFGIAPSSETIEYAGPFEMAKMWNIVPGPSGKHDPPDGVIQFWHAMREQFPAGCFSRTKCECGL